VIEACERCHGNWRNIGWELIKTGGSFRELLRELVKDEMGAGGSCGRCDGSWWELWKM
jgi:hypothetical protein